ncbi:MAG: aldo/keto reductase [candidate division Zixibacteria bacterium]|nr:aldo/keto reductase [candidate division Zixibacteria bacterium]
MQKNDHDLTRRGFLATAASGLVTAGLAGLTPAQALAQEAAQTATPKKDVTFRTLGRTGIKVPIVSIGAMNADNPELMQAAYEMGIRHFDTAAVYQFGRNEQMVGRVVKQMGIRDKVIIGTKIHTTEQRRGLTPEQHKTRMLKTLNGCLKRLKTDYVDILSIHDVGDAAVVADEAIIETMKEIVKSGKARFTGIATHSNMATVINAVTKGGFYDTVLTSFNFTMADDTDLMKAIADAAAAGVGILAMKTQAGGAQLPNPASRETYSASVRNLAALKWVMRNENVHTSIPGCASLEQVEEDFSVASNFEYTEEESKFLADNSIKLSLGFCRQCRRCLASCPGGADIPTLMRTHMYAAQYSNFHQARYTLDNIPSGQNLSACTSCSECVAQCVRAVDIPKKIAELKLIYA